MEKKSKEIRPTALQLGFMAFAKVPVRLYLRLKYGLRVKPVTIDEPFIAIANHTTEKDILIMPMIIKNYFFYVCGEQILRNKLARWFFKNFFNPVPLAKGSIAADATMGIFKRMKSRNNMCIFPEGTRSSDGCTNPFAESTGKLIKKSGMALVTVKLHGGYFTAPRWTNKFRSGRISAEIVHIYPSEEVKAMSAQEIYMHLTEDIYEDAYALQKEHMYPYRGRKLAEGMENFLYFCPKCGKFDTIRTKGNDFFCTSCGMKGTYDVYGMLNSNDMSYRTIPEWEKYDLEKFEEMYASSDITFTIPDASLMYVDLKTHDGHPLLAAPAVIDKEGIRIGDCNFPYLKMDATDYMNCGNTFLFTHDGTYYNLKASRLNAVIIRRLYIKAKEAEAARTGKKFDIAK